MIEETLKLIPEHYGHEVDLAHLPQDDPAVYEALQKADTIGMFQVESRAQMSSLPRMRPKKFYDIVVQVAIIRPGPIVGKMVHPYLNRRLGREPVECLHPSLEPVLRRTLGVPLFQEQLLKMAMIAASFTGGEAEELRRAMGFKRSEKRMAEIEEVLLDAVADVTGIPETFSTAVTEGSTVGQAPAGTRAIQLRDPDTFFSRFLELYGRSNRGAVPERNNKPNLSQAMHVLAGATYVDRLSRPNSRLAKLLQSGASDAGIFTEFYLASLSRTPSDDEVQELKTILAQRGDREAGLREFVWALISSREFAENH